MFAGLIKKTPRTVRLPKGPGHAVEGRLGGAETDDKVKGQEEQRQITEATR